MSRKSSIQYNPKLSVKENAILNNVSESGIYYHIRSQSINREEDRANNLIAKITQAIKNNPEASPFKISKNRHQIQSRVLECLHFPLFIQFTQSYWSNLSSIGTISLNAEQVSTIKDFLCLVLCHFQILDVNYKSVKVYKYSR
ncbi:MAG: hypothetical protein K6A41_10865 [Bacteroidales bacterium]|nr:hypothetical protein [Bacteroidales bacterium]